MPRPQSGGGVSWEPLVSHLVVSDPVALSAGLSAGAQGQHRKLLLSWSRRTWRMKSKTDETALQDMLCAALHAAECPA